MAGFIFKLFYPFAKIYWFIFRPKTYGVKCAVFNNGKLLLVKHTYGSDRWMFPGGGMSKGESGEKTAEREIWEELGIRITDIKKVREFKSEKQYKKDTFTLFKAISLSKELTINKWEIKEALWFNLDELPPLSDWSQMAIKLAVD